MRHVLLAGLLVAGPAAAQQSGTTALDQQRQEIQNLNETTGAARSFGRAGELVGHLQRSAEPSGLAWGRCVTSIAPDDAYSYVTLKRADERRVLKARLAPVFERCRQAGFSLGDRTARGSIRRALAVKVGQ